VKTLVLEGGNAADDDGEGKSRRRPGVKER